MDTEDGENFIKRLAYYVRTHELALANALQPQSRPQSRNSLSSIQASQRLNIQNQQQNYSSTSLLANEPTTPTSVLSRATVGLNVRRTKPISLTLSLNQLYYLLCRFEELEVDVGSMNIRLENIHSETSASNYVSFLAHNPNIRGSDHGSIHSIASVHNVVSKVSSMLSTLGLNAHRAAKEEKRKAAMFQDIKYLYSAFTKIPSLEITHAQIMRARLISGHEEFPFDTAVPLHAFKNLTKLEIRDLDFRSIFGWDRLADQLRNLTLRRAGLENISDLTTGIVLDDVDQRRRQTCKTPPSPILPNAILASRSRDPTYTPMSLDRSTTPTRARESNSGSSNRPDRNDTEATSWESKPLARSNSSGLIFARKTDSQDSNDKADKRHRDGSELSSSGNLRLSTPRRSSTNLLINSFQLTSKWCFLRHLSLSDNGITTIDNAGLMPLAETLQSFDLSHNLFTEFPDSLTTLKSLRLLNLSNCMIDSLRSLASLSLPGITTLNLRSNRLNSLSGIETLTGLERLDLRDNQLRDPVELARLTNMLRFRDVYLRGNPFVKMHRNYRITIFNLFRKNKGFKHDITIDTLGPSQGETNQLVDRPPSTSSDSYENRDIKEAQRNTVFDEQVIQTTEASTGKRVLEIEGSGEDTSARRGSKRRVVDIVSDTPSLEIKASTSTLSTTRDLLAR